MHTIIGISKKGCYDKYTLEYIYGTFKKKKQAKKEAKRMAKKYSKNYIVLKIY